MKWYSAKSLKRKKKQEKKNTQNKNNNNIININQFKLENVRLRLLNVDA